jgi:hypothetical protein
MLDMAVFQQTVVNTPGYASLLFASRDPLRRPLLIPMLPVRERFTQRTPKPC